MPVADERGADEGVEDEPLIRAQVPLMAADSQTWIRPGRKRSLLFGAGKGAAFIVLGHFGFAFWSHAKQDKLHKELYFAERSNAREHGASGSEAKRIRMELSRDDITAAEREAALEAAEALKVGSKARRAEEEKLASLRIEHAEMAQTHRRVSAALYISEFLGAIVGAYIASRLGADGER